MGPKRPRTRVGYTGDYAILRRLTSAANPDIDELRAAIERVAASPHRLRAAEGRVYVAACTRYHRLTGEKIGPEAITY